MVFRLYFTYILLGVFELKITNILDPAKSRMIRGLDKKFFKWLEEKMEADPSSAGVPPVAVLYVLITRFEL